jgi:SAM-dependent methyltransferase
MDSIKDFGNQFNRHQDISGVWGSEIMLLESIFPFNLMRVKNKDICEVGSGSGRYLKNFLNYDPKSLTAIDPASSLEIARKNNPDKGINFLNVDSTKMSIEDKFDFVFSIGVIHHIPEAQKAVDNIYKSLRKNGEFVMWVYGYENNEIYVFIFNNLRRVLSRLPDFIVEIFSYMFTLISYVYIWLCKFLKLPLKKYFLNVFSKFSFKHKFYVIFDQLNPKYSKYYKKNEAVDLFKNSGFEISEINHRDEYSWTVIGKKN